MTHSPPRTLDLVAEATPVGEPGWPPRVICTNLNLSTPDDALAPTTVRHALRELVGAGRLKRTGQPGAMLYWRSGP